MSRESFSSNAVNNLCSQLIHDKEVIAWAADLRFPQWQRLMVLACLSSLLLRNCLEQNLARSGMTAQRNLIFILSEYFVAWSTPQKSHAMFLSRQHSSHTHTHAGLSWCKNSYTSIIVNTFLGASHLKTCFIYIYIYSISRGEMVNYQAAESLTLKNKRPCHLRALWGLSCVYKCMVTYPSAVCGTGRCFFSPLTCNCSM